MSAHAFDFDLPEKESNWFKYTEGEQKIRIMSEPIRGWEEWDEVNEKRTPVRYRFNEKPDTPIDPEKPVKLFISMIVWNYTKKKIEIFHCDKMGIIKELKKLAEDADWGSLYDYDLRIKREGKEQQTRYTVTPLPQKPLELSIKAAFKAKPIDLEQIYTNGDPFKPLGKVTQMALDEPHSKAVSKDRTEELSQILVDANCEASRLEDYVNYYAKLKKVPVSEVIDSCLRLNTSTLVSNFNAWVAKNPTEEVPF